MHIDLNAGGVSDFLTKSNALSLLGLWIAYHALRALYNVSPLHPLSRFPGPKLAASTLWYEFWYDMVLGGEYTNRIREMHGVYGPIVRISPGELHCDDPAFIDEIYASSGRIRDKSQHFLNFAAGPNTLSAFATIDHELHRIRRSAINRFFSQAQISKLEPGMKKLVQLLCNKLLRQPKNKPLDITTAYSCFTSDVISDYCFGEPVGFLEQDGWEPNFREAMKAFLGTTFLFRFFPALRVLVHLAPHVARFMSDHVALLMKEMHVNLPARVRAAHEERKKHTTKERSSIFTDILDSSLPDSEKTDTRLAGEAFSLMGAGTETTAWTLTVITFYLLSRPEFQNRLAEGLSNVDLDHASLLSLEALPYLRAVISEGLRLSYGVASRSPRIARDEDLIYAREIPDRGRFQYVIPRGTSIGMSSVLLHDNEDVFPDAKAFNPGRWLDEQGEYRRSLEKFLFAFSRGSRQCIGIHLARSELYFTTAALVTRVIPRMELFETTVEDVQYDHDMTVSQPKRGSKGVRVIIS